jgi:hypothetical protein
MTVNISSTGVLFRTDAAAESETPMDIEIVLPGNREFAVRVTSRGTVTRAFVPPGEPGDRAMAVTFGTYGFVRSARNGVS